MTKKLRSSLCIVMVMLTIALTVPTAAISVFAAELQPPTELKSSSTTSTIALSWKAAESATGYRVFYRTRTGWKKSIDVTGTSVNYRNLPAGTKYTFAVKSFYRCGHSPNVTWSRNFATIETATAPHVPARVKLASDGTRLAVSWTPSKGADGYVLYFKHMNKWKELKNTAGTSVTLDRVTQGYLFTFAIRPYINTKNGTVWGDYKEFTGATAPKATKLEASSPARNTVKLTWSKVCFADGYALYYKYNNGGYKLLRVYNDAQKDLTFSNLAAGKYTFVVRPFVKTSVGLVCGPYTPVVVEVSGLLPCGCEPVCAYCTPSSTKNNCPCRRAGRR